MENMLKTRPKLMIGIYVAILAVIIGVIIFITFHFTVYKFDLTVNVSQIGEEQNVLVKWDTTKPIDYVNIKVKHNGVISYQTTIRNSSDIVKGQYVVPAFYGKQNVIISSMRGSYEEKVTKQVNVSASEYNIAPLTATMPVTMFSLALMDTTSANNITNGGTIPTFVWFKRSGAWNYANMPENVYTIPTATGSQIVGESNQRTIYKNTSAWVKELYEINSNSKFNFFYSDLYSYGWLQATVANGIPADKYHVTLLSDGLGSFDYFNKHFKNKTNEEAVSEYQQMKNDYETLKKQIAEKETYVEDTNKFIINAKDLGEYSYLMANEEANVEWWITRKDGTICDFRSEEDRNVKLPNNTIQEDVKNAGSDIIQIKDLKSLCDTLSSDEKDGLKVLYNFSEDFFEKAVDEGKNVMMFLGTWTESENNFDEYVEIMKLYYGENYVYYYKGHPRNPTNSVEGKYDHLESLDLTDLDSTISAELFFFFNQDIAGSGYQTSTFLSTNDAQTGLIFGTSKTAFVESYKDNVDAFVTKLANNDANYGELIDNDTSFIIEFNKAEDLAKYDIAIYDYATKTIKYYKNKVEVNI